MTECCVARATCPTNNCPTDMIAIAEASTTFCEGSTCDLVAGSADTNSCCENKGTCSGFDCPDTMVGAASPPSSCVGSECRLDECCVARAPCSSSDCPDSKVWVGEGLLCAGETCALDPDAATCCENRAECSENVCSSDFYFSAAQGDLCLGAICTAEADLHNCCVERSTCDTKAFDCGSGYGEKLGSLAIRCAENVCTEGNDHNMCCELKDTCDSMREGAATTTCNTFTGTCQYGLRKEPWTIPCSGSCTETTCCREETGDPLPESRPQGKPADRDVLVYKTRVTGLSYEKAMEKEDDLTSQFKPVFARAGGVAVDQVVMVYGEGSLLVTAEITALPGETLDQSATTLPSSSEVLAAVNNVPAIQEAIIPGQILAAAEPIGVRYAPGEEGAAEAITPPPPPTPPNLKAPSPPPPPDSSDDESDDDEEENASRTSAAHMSMVGWQVLPLCFASMTFILVH